MSNLEVAKAAALAAGGEILAIYGSADFGVEAKSDDSPLTLADKRAHKVIMEHLEPTGIPVLSEEGRELPYEDRKAWSQFWLVDPLDGTKEFIKRNGEFTVNIALIEDGRPVMGVVYAPVLDDLYWGDADGAYLEEQGEQRSIAVAQSLGDGEVLKVVASRSHRSEELEAWLAALPAHECHAIGSSLKLCQVASGDAHVYPRIGPTMEWDTGAAHAVVLAAGGEVVDLDGQALQYNKENLLNPYFIVKSGVSYE